METPSGLSFFVHILINFFFYLKKKFLGKFGLVRFKGPVFMGRMAGAFSAMIVLIVLAFGTLSTGYLLFKSLTSHPDLSLVDQLPSLFGQAQISNADKPQMAKTFSPASEIAPPDSPSVSDQANSSENTDQIVNSGEGIWNAVYRQVETQIQTDPVRWGLAENNLKNKTKLKKILDIKVSEILINNGIIKKDGSQMLMVTPGTRVVVDQDGGVKIFGDSYFKKMDRGLANDVGFLRI